MKVLFLTDGITPYNTGGMQKHSYVVSKLLAKNNCEVTLVHCGYFNNSDFSENYKGIFTEAELKKITPLFIPFISDGKLPGHYITESKTYSQDIKNKINTDLEKFDLIYAQGFTGWNFLENNENIPVIVNLHGFEMFQKAPNLKVKLEHYLLRPFVKKIINKADYVLSFGGQIDDILSSLNIAKAKIIQQSNGIEENWITQKDPKPMKVKTITFIGRYERRKGIEELASALKELIKTDLAFQFNFIGPIDKENQIQHSNIKYLGEIKDLETIKQSLDQSDFLISPSYAEGMPTVILEAMARGNAILATNVGANVKMIDKNGWIIAHSPESILKSLIKAIKISDSELVIMKQNSVHNVKSLFVWEQVIESQIEAFKKII